MEITIKDVVETKVDPAELNPDTLGFGVRFTDRIFTMAYDADRGGWHDPTIGPLESFSLHPASVCFHYGQTIFEGMKAFAREGGQSALFRPELNLQRMNRSAQRMSMPAIDGGPVLEAMTELVRLERQWIPAELGSSLYIRPTMIGTEEFLGVRPANRYLFFIILSPVGPYFKGGIGKPIKIMASHKFTRAAEGGTGEAKCGGNYGASLLANEEAKEQGYSQVLWLDAKEHRLVEEIGAMNVMFVFNNSTIVTSPLTGTILPGITRRTVIEMAPALGYDVEERSISIEEVVMSVRQGKITEMFGCGTAAVVTPIGTISDRGEEFSVCADEPGPVTRHLYETITGIQYGKAEDTYGWMKIVE